jgi:hypothetical protein
MKLPLVNAGEESKLTEYIITKASIHSIKTADFITFPYHFSALLQG